MGALERLEHALVDVRVELEIEVERDSLENLNVRLLLRERKACVVLASQTHGQLLVERGVERPVELFVERDQRARLRASEVLGPSMVVVDFGDTLNSAGLHPLVDVLPPLFPRELLELGFRKGLRARMRADAARALRQRGGGPVREHLALTPGQRARHLLDITGSPNQRFEVVARRIVDGSRLYRLRVLLALGARTVGDLLEVLSALLCGGEVQQLLALAP